MVRLFHGKISQKKTVIHEDACQGAFSKSKCAKSYQDLFFFKFSHVIISPFVEHDFLKLFQVTKLKNFDPLFFNNFFFQFSNLKKKKTAHTLQSAEDRLLIGRSYKPAS